MSETQPKIIIQCEKEGLSVTELWSLVYNMEVVGDECKRIAKYVSDAELIESERKIIRDLYDRIMHGYELVMKSFYKKDKELAHDVAYEKNPIIEECVKLIDKTDSTKTVVIVEKLKRMEGAIRDLTRVIIDLN